MEGDTPVALSPLERPTARRLGPRGGNAAEARQEDRACCQAHRPSVVAHLFGFDHLLRLHIDVQCMAFPRLVDDLHLTEAFPAVIVSFDFFLRAYPNNWYTWLHEYLYNAPKRTRTRTPNNRTTTGFRISDALWAVLAPLLPVQVNTHRFGGGRPRVPDRRCADAIFYVLRTGCQWEALNQTGVVCQIHRPRSVSGLGRSGTSFLKLWQGGVAQFDELQGIDWAWLSMDGAMTKAPLGGEKTGPNPTDRAKGGVKRSLLTEGHGVPIGLAVEGANRHDMKLVRATLESLVVERPAPTPEQPQGMCLDKAYDF